MNSITFKALSASRVFAIPLRQTFALYKAQCRSLISANCKSTRQAAFPQAVTRTFMTSPRLLKKKKYSPGNTAYAKGSKKSGGPVPKMGGKKGGSDGPMNWRDADKWRRQMNEITDGIQAATSYEQVEKGVNHWTNILNAGIQGGVPAAILDSTVKRNRRSSANLAAWVTDEEEADELGMFVSDLQSINNDEDLERRRREWNQKLKNNPYMDEVEEEELSDEEEYEQYRREIIGPEYDRMSEEERSSAQIRWEEEAIGKDLVGDDEWDKMSKEERDKVIVEWREQEDKLGKDVFGTKWETMSPIEKDEAMREYIGWVSEEDQHEEKGLYKKDKSIDKGDDEMMGYEEMMEKLISEEIEGLDSENEGDIDIDDGEDLEAELGGHHNGQEPGALEDGEDLQEGQSGYGKEGLDLDELEERPEVTSKENSKEKRRN